MSVQNQVSHLFLQDPDLHQREIDILTDITQKTAFTPTKRIGESRYWDSKVAGASFYQGDFQGQTATLKIQAVKTPTSEIDQIKNFHKHNHSQIIRPPQLYAHIRWQKEQQYEALILETVFGNKIVSLPTNQKQITQFFQLYNEYRQNCLHSPWLDKPQHSISDKIIDGYKKWRQIRQKLYQDHPHAHPQDDGLIDQAVSLLAKNYQHVELEFVHGHFSHNDLLHQSQGDYVLLSNLYWSWRPPFYDTIFAYHWFTYHLANVTHITSTTIESQRQLWLDQIKSYAKTDADKYLLNLALLERATAGLNLDALSVDSQLPISAYLVESTRDRLTKLINNLS